MVHLAQQLVAHEVVVAETAKVQQKARAAVTAVSAVEMAAKELGQVRCRRRWRQQRGGGVGVAATQGDVWATTRAGG